LLSHTNVSQRSVATCARCGGILITTLLKIYQEIFQWKKLWKSVKMWQNNGHEFVAPLFGRPCILQPPRAVCRCIALTFERLLRYRQNTASTINFRHVGLKALSQLQTNWTELNVFAAAKQLGDAWPMNASCNCQIPLQGGPRGVLVRERGGTPFR